MADLWFPEGFDWKAPDYTEVWKERAERLKRIREPGFDLDALHQFYAENPTNFIHDWGCTFDPRNVERGIDAVVPFLLFKRQAQFIDWLIERWKNREDGLVEKSRDMGVSWLCVAAAAWMWRYKKGTVVGFGSRKEEYVDKIGDPKSLFWKLRQFINLLPKEFTPEGYSEKVCAPHMRVINPENGAAIIGEAGDNIGRGNRTSIYLKDESAFYERAEAVDAALSQTSNCKIDVSTPNGSGNPFYNKRHGGRIAVFIFDWKQDPRKDADWYRKQCETLDPIIVAQEIDRNYESSVTNAFIPGELVSEAMSKGPADIKPMGGLRVGIDVARFGDDKTVITFRRGRVLLKQIALAKLDVAQVAGRARAEIAAYGEKPEQIAVDTIGIGAGVADMLRAWFPKKNGQDVVVDVNASLRMSNGLDYNLRAQMWREMREWLKSASIPNDQDLRTDLTALRYGFRGGELLLESKEDAKRRGVKSPDRGDSLALTFAIPTKVREQSRAATQSFQPLNSAFGY